MKLYQLYHVSQVNTCSIMWSYQAIKFYQVSHEFIVIFQSLLRHQIQHRLEPLVLHQAPEDLRVERRARLDVVAQGLGARAENIKVYNMLQPSNNGF